MIEDRFVEIQTFFVNPIFKGDLIKKVWILYCIIFPKEDIQCKRGSPENVKHELPLTSITNKPANFGGLVAH